MTEGIASRSQVSVQFWLVSIHLGTLQEALKSMIWRTAESWQNLNLRGLNLGRSCVSTGALLVQPYYRSNWWQLTTQSRVAHVSAYRTLTGHFNWHSFSLTDNHERVLGQLNKDAGVCSEVGAVHLGIDPWFCLVHAVFAVLQKGCFTHFRNRVFWYWLIFWEATFLP